MKQMNLQILFSNNLKAERIKKGLTQQNLADKVDMSLRYIQRLEQEGVNVTLETVEKFSKALDCQPSQLLSISNLKISKRESEILNEAVKIINGLLVQK